MIKAGNSYKVFSKATGVSKNGKKFMRGRISDSQKNADGKYESKGWYDFIIFESDNDYASIEELASKDYIKITRIYGVEFKSNEYKGKQYQNLTLFINANLSERDRKNTENNFYSKSFNTGKQKVETDEQFGIALNDADLPF